MPAHRVAPRFQDKVVIVTGAASGIGEATARRFFDEGALVVLADRQQSKLENVASTLAKDRILTHVTDVAHYGQVEALMNTTLRRFGSMCSSTMPASPLAAESSMQA